MLVVLELVQYSSYFIYQCTCCREIITVMYIVVGKLVTLLTVAEKVVLVMSGHFSGFS
jgi:hypothetical protein